MRLAFPRVSALMARLIIKRGYREEDLSTEQFEAPETPWLSSQDVDPRGAQGIEQPQSKGTEATCGLNSTQAIQRVARIGAFPDIGESGNDRSSCVYNEEIEERRARTLSSSLLPAPRPTVA